MSETQNQPEQTPRVLSAAEGRINGDSLEQLIRDLQQRYDSLDDLLLDFRRARPQLMRLFEELALPAVFRAATTAAWYISQALLVRAFWSPAESKEMLDMLARVVPGAAPHRPARMMERDRQIWRARRQPPKPTFGQLGCRFGLKPQAAREAWHRQYVREKETIANLFRVAAAMTDPQFMATLRMASGLT